MEQYKPGGKKTNIWVWIVTAIVAILGIIIIIIANFTNVMKWLRICGVAMIIIAAPILLFLAFMAIKNRIDKI